MRGWPREQIPVKHKWQLLAAESRMDEKRSLPERRTLIGRWLRIVAGSLLVGLGVVGLFLPFLQGVLFIVVGLSLLSTESERARRIHQWARARWHRLRARGAKGDSVHGIG